MDPTSRFFTKLRRLAVTLETETVRLQQVYQTRNLQDEENTERAMQAYHELYSEVRDLKGEMRDQLTQQRPKQDEVSCFLKACMVMDQRFTEDIDRLTSHCEKYGYQVPQNAQKRMKVKGRGPEGTDKAATAEEEEEDAQAAGGAEGNQEEAGEDLLPATPTNAAPPPAVDPMRTPQLADFGLSELHLRKVLGGALLPPMPEMSLPPRSLCMPMPPTPRCTLRMDEDDQPDMPQMHHFGISEHTMCFNNDFTMDLHRKDVQKAQRPPNNLSTPQLTPVKDSTTTKADRLETPEPPVFCTPGFKITKSGACSVSPPPVEGSADSPCRPGNLQTTPEVPAFQTPYINRLLSSRKGVREVEPGDMQADDDNPVAELTTPLHRETTSTRAWEYDVPEMSFRGDQSKRTPEMPSLESILGGSLISRAAGLTRDVNERTARGSGEPCAPSLELDEPNPTQEFNLGTPRVRRGYLEPSTPEMPDLSSVTQDICKLVSQTHLKKSTTAVVLPNPRPPGKENRVLTLPLVSESEFHSLPSYLRQMTLSSLNQALHKINSAAAEKSHGEKAEFVMEDLRRITAMGTKAPIYLLCLTELKRLQHLQGVGNSSVYKMLSHS
ncbi:SKA complex subunit 3 [Polymixia lowei]